MDGLSAEASDGELLLGPSGCGKTTILSCLAGLLMPASGSVTVGDTEVTSLQGAALAHYRRHGVGVVFQAFNLIPSLSARENVAAPLKLAGAGRSEANGRAEALLERVGLNERMRHRPGALSGGEQQRVAIARALVHDAPLVVADEPTAHLDYVQVEPVLELVRGLAVSGRVAQEIGGVALELDVSDAASVTPGRRRRRARPRSDRPARPRRRHRELVRGCDLGTAARGLVAGLRGQRARHVSLLLGYPDDAPWTPPTLAAQLVRVLASGRADRLSGRYIHAERDDIEELIVHADRVIADDLHAIRLRR